MQTNKIRVIVTSGPTREFFDPIRFLSNPSTGKMGYYTARAAHNHGFEVIYISGPVDHEYSKIPEAVNISVVSTIEMLDSVRQYMQENTILIMAAAPADYRPDKKFQHKIKKSEHPSLQLIPNPDILKTIDELRTESGWKNTFLIGFAAETETPDEYALKKLHGKNLDMIFLNDLSRIDSGFGVDTNQLTVFRKNGTKTIWESDTKERLGYKIVQEIEAWLQS